MKEIVALAFFLAVSVSTIILAYKDKIKISLASMFLVFAIIGGFAITNYDVIKLLKWGNLEIQTFEQDVKTIKQSALEDVEKQVDEQKESLSVLIRDLNALSGKLEDQNESLSKLVTVAEELQKKIEIQKNDIISLNNKAENTKEEIESLNDISAEIALILVRATYYTIETKNEFGTDRAKTAMEEIENDLNAILPRIIPNPEERANWIKELKEKLPKRK